MTKKSLPSYMVYIEDMGATKKNDNLKRSKKICLVCYVGNKEMGGPSLTILNRIVREGLNEQGQ